MAERRRRVKRGRPPTDEPNRKHVSIRLHPEVLQAVTDAAKGRQMRRSTFIEWALRKFLGMEA